MESFEMRCWRRMEKIGWTDSVRNEEVLHRVKTDRSILQTIKRRNVNWIGRMLCRNCFLQHAIRGKVEGSMEVIERWARRCKQPLEDIKKKKNRLLEIEGLSTETLSVENSLWKRLQTCRKTDYSLNEVFWEGADIEGGRV
jgi:hypothetical protein